MPVASDTLMGENSALSTHPPALKVFLWGIPQTPTKGGNPPLDSPYSSGQAQQLS